MKRDKSNPHWLRQEKRLLTNENWYPTREDGTVKASLLSLSDGKFRVCVWGEDDFGLERDYESLLEAREAFKALPSVVEQKYLKDSLGFRRS